MSPGGNGRAASAEQVSARVPAAGAWKHERLRAASGPQRPGTTDPSAVCRPGSQGRKGAWGAAPGRGAGTRGPVHGRAGCRGACVRGSGLPLPRRRRGPPAPLAPGAPSLPPSPPAGSVGSGLCPARSPAAPRGGPRANTAERRGSRAAPAPQIFGPRGGGLAGQLRACGRGEAQPGQAPPAAPAPAGRAFVMQMARWRPRSALGRAPRHPPLTWGGGGVSAPGSGPGQRGRPALSSRRGDTDPLDAGPHAQVAGLLWACLLPRIPGKGICGRWGPRLGSRGRSSPAAVCDTFRGSTPHPGLLCAPPSQTSGPGPLPSRPLQALWVLGTPLLCTPASVFPPVL